MRLYRIEEVQYAFYERLDQSPPPHAKLVNGTSCVKEPFTKLRIL